ncbi:hypothetical protein GCM10011416_08780 [Polaribacter pacificus]|uniref:SPOR domain-containing protein n=1 Tax=Polaribacter pacificus TaxID=1775173 RepID=A0A917HXE6_9FLAO|nr:SPOR domain-containing protein [Polaribacter pacificus]GGG93786.1 hypothetical protein GCM10011416_08780 [Polaribacter pacificus]
MILANYISDLLYRYDCVIVPNFGGFVTNAVSAKLNAFSHTFYPPSKQITFNAHLKNNDGLLANHIAVSEQISFDKATELIANSVLDWQKQLKNSGVELATIGQLTLNKEQQLVFEPTPSTNYLTSSFGLESVSSPSIKRAEYQEQATKLMAVKTAKKSSSFFKYAATAAVVLTLGAFGWNGYQVNQQKEMAAQQQKEVENKIQSATFVIDTPLPTINLTLETAAPKNFHIIAGAFQFPENAAQKLSELKKAGFDAQIIGKNKWGLIQVTFKSLSTRKEAEKELASLKKSHSEDAWLLIKKL